MNRRRAFTLAESLIVLALVAAIMLVTVPPAQRGAARAREDHFWREFRQSWQVAQTRAKVAHQASTLEYDDSGHRLIFAGQGWHRGITLPRTLVMREWHPVRMHADGYVAPQTWELVSRLDGREYYVRIQLGWGGYHVEKGPAGRVHFSGTVVGTGGAGVSRGDPRSWD